MRVSSSSYDLKNQPSKNFCYTTSELVEELKKYAGSFYDSRTVNSLPNIHPELKNYRRKKGNMWMWHKHWRRIFRKYRILNVINTSEEMKEIEELEKVKDIIIMLYNGDHMSKDAKETLLELLNGLKIFL